MSNRAIPVVDLSTYLHGSEMEKMEFVAILGEAFNKVGFVAVKNHGVPKTLIDNFYASAKAFFAFPLEVKKQYEIPGMAGQRGYTSFGIEHAKHSQHADLKEFFQIGQEVEGETKEVYPPNIFIKELPEFTELGIQLYKSFENSGKLLLQAISQYLGLDANYFDEKIWNGNSILRAIHYPPITQEPDSSIRAEQHEDINLITLLVGASAGGLQLLDMNGEWKAITPEEDEIVVNVGDMLQRLTNNFLRSTTHRVVNPPREEWHLPRLSIPFFLHPVRSMDLSCLENCISDDNPMSYESIEAGGYLDERLKEIGLKK